MLKVTKSRFPSGKKLTVLFLLSFTFTQVYSQWSPLGSGMSNEVDALCFYNYDYIAGGFFSTAGSVNVNKIAKWDGAWSPLGTGIDTTPYGQVDCLLAGPNTNLYVGGTFSYAGGDTAAKNIARWDGSSWHPLGYGLYGGVNALIFGNNGLLYAGGDFSNVRYGVPARFIAQWNGSSWDSLPGGNNLDSWVSALTIYNDQLIAGGSFIHAGGVILNHIARWTGSSWTPLGSGVDNSISTLMVYNGNLIAGGDFTHAGGVNANFIAQWNGSSWSPLGNGLNGGGKALAVYHGNRYIWWITILYLQMGWKFLGDAWRWYQWQCICLICKLEHSRCGRPIYNSWWSQRKLYCRFC
jgi:hypothetical protein